LTSSKAFPEPPITRIFQDPGKKPGTGFRKKFNQLWLPENEEKSTFLLTFIGEKDPFLALKRP